MIGDLLGHRMVTTTARYAHLARDSVREATAKVGDDLGASLAADMDTPPSAPSTA